MNNSGLLLFMDILIATVGLALVIRHTVARRHDPVPPPARGDAGNLADQESLTDQIG